MKYNTNHSHFDGTLRGLVWNRLLAILITVLTGGICYPWAVVIMMEWETRHTVINGQRLAFDGNAMQLFGSWINGGFSPLSRLAFIAFGWGLKCVNGKQSTLILISKKKHQAFFYTFL